MTPRRARALVTLDDIFEVMLALNIKDGRIRANYQILKEFFAELRRDSRDWASDQVKYVLNLIESRDVDHMMTRVFGFGGGTFVAEVGEDFYYMKPEQVRSVTRYYDGLAQDDKDSLAEIARRYGERLAELEG